jgi:anti-sigma regulatory factor (Ser/Thr protein kinase)
VSFAVGAPTPASVAGFRHEAFLYRSIAECVTGVKAFVDEGGGRGEPALVVAPTATLSGLSAGRAAKVEVLCEDAEQLARNPARLISAVDSFLDERAESGSARVVLEPLWPGRSRAEVDEVVLHEVLVNLALADRTVSLLCPYNAGGLGPELPDQLTRTHPEIVEGGAWRASTDFADPADMLNSEVRPLTTPPDTAATINLSRQKLPRIRQFVRLQGGVAGLSPDRVGELVLAVNEIVTNSLVHAPGAGVLRVWTGPAELVCEVADNGRIEDPLAGRHPPTEDAERRRGLWIVNQLCDLVELRSGAGGTQVRLHMARRSDGGHR